MTQSEVFFFQSGKYCISMQWNSIRIVGYFAPLVRSYSYNILPGVP